MRLDDAQAEKAENLISQMMDQTRLASKLSSACMKICNIKYPAAISVNRTSKVRIVAKNTWAKIQHFLC